MSLFTRAIVLVLDSVGIGELPDAGVYGDQGSNTLGHIAERVPLKILTLRALGLGLVATLGDPPPPELAVRGETAAAFDRRCIPPGRVAPPSNIPDILGRRALPAGRIAGLGATRQFHHGLLAPSAVGRMAEASPGKDSVTGHWEMMGVVLDRPFPVFPHGFSQEILAEFSRQTGRGVLGNKAASGTAIIDELGSEHIRTGSFIVYTSADSVFQIAAHEDVVPVPELYRACEAAYKLVGEGLHVGRVIARPFVGTPGRFKRTANRRDYALPPSGVTLLDRLTAASREVVAVGKIEDLFAGRGITRAIHTASDDEGMDTVLQLMDDLGAGLIFANLVDFDTQYGHRNDVHGYAENLERFDLRLADIMRRLREADLLVITADHGNDPSTPSTDHSREYVPLIVTGAHVRKGTDLGTRSTFADLGQTLAEMFGVPRLAHGTSFLNEIA